MLRNLAGKPLVQWTWEAACRSGADEILIATDSEEVRSVCEAFGAEVHLTSPLHASGTDRVAEVAQLKRWADDMIVVNLQGDEPLMPPQLADRVATLLAKDRTADISTLARPLHDENEWRDPACVKVVRDGSGRALYFSRAPIPWLRDSASGQNRFPSGLALRHIGMYAYRVGTLKRLSGLPVAPIEACEALEQLRALVNGVGIIVAVVDIDVPCGVDTEADFSTVASIVSSTGDPQAG